MYNFLDPKLSPKVSSTTSVTDNYEVTNLISANFATKSRGFLAYCTVKPPVTITFELICPINIHYITLWTTHGAHRCTAIEILAKNFSKQFKSIGYASKFNNTGIVFCNNRIYSVNNPPPNIDPSFHLTFFKPHSFRSFSTADAIKVCIVRTERSVPCLGKIEIWGKPSKMCSSTTINTINRLMQKPISVCVVSTDSSSTIDDWDIPDEFKDMLTFDVMATPITLPSGNAVDQSTMEKYIANEASYGRAPSDPFTGQVFTDTRKPVFNAALKSRIDMFLVQHAHRSETFTVNRTVGKVSGDGDKKISGKRKADVFIKDDKRIKSCANVETIVSSAKCSDVDEKLNEAIRKTMNSSSFVCFTNEETIVSADIDCCVKCSNSNSLYVIPCKHLYCRKCLLDACTELKCQKCESSFDKNDVKKFHA